MKTVSKISALSLFLVLFFSCNAQQKDNETQKAYEDKITATNHAIFKAWNTADVSLLKANLSSDYKRTQNGENNANSKDAYVELMQMFTKAIPDFKFTYELLVIKDNKIYTRWTARGTNSGSFGDQPATGKSSVTHGFTILTFNKEGKVTAEEAYFDQLSYLQAWGYTLAPPIKE